MANAYFNVPIATNEPVKGYAPGSKEKEELLATYKELKNKKIEIPMVIGGKAVTSDAQVSIHPPHDHKHELGFYHKGNTQYVHQAIEAALEARKTWANTPWQDRAAIFLKAADLLAGPYRARMNAATMLCQSKNAFQAEIDAACEMIDFFKFNVQYMIDIYKEQPESLPGVWNRMEYRPLEGFVLAITPFNFTSICANLCAAPALMGNVVVWKPANTQIYSAHVIMELFKEAGLPDGVINIVYASGPEFGEAVFKHPDFSGLHFTGSTGVFKNLWKTIGNNIDLYKSYPRIVGETGGKDFIIAHKSADAKEVATAISRGAFEFQGQKCSAASRAYIPSNIADEVIKYVKENLASFKMGSPEDFSNFINAVIDEKSFDKIASFIEYTKTKDDAKIICGGKYDKSVGYFVEPTVVLTTNPHFRTMCEEIFGPFMTIYVYDADGYEEALQLLDATSEYALTGAIFAKERPAINLATKVLENAAGNFYINDKPTGAVVGQQPFGGARASGTNDKAGSYLNLIRWTSPRTIKETFVPAKDYRYPFLG
ncbi:MAG: L-glutamate gamma-semialdehyde dehydrogenase [Flavobacteriales bacterium]|nr:L-glutamate gamma-semialdehyde dehydrogenase [Flavobacteriales bacterium]MCW8913511.1 L-glutamate gamma-semialdehyde dehydrogenase [Flavobacteriales bacterium]MCW8937344.1 L-glutamate gamma-semialdehyde dehydrogenase [Flavobacteriales bacterium]MCW8941509.1 L-glutamate gamma-semialdehyde dehydrogenase [Flavobacteriales bacterium]MCW8968173.1 L-glutamate gamma-semialdehyde dehydrogenase [Flavobacteriales bacterium]